MGENILNQYVVKILYFKCYVLILLVCWDCLKNAIVSLQF